MNDQAASPETGRANHRTLLIGILVLAFVVRVAAMLLLQTWNFPFERAFGAESGEIGYALANGQGFSWPQTWRPVGPMEELVKREHPVPTTWEAPVQPTIIGVAFWLFGSYTPQAAIALELFQILLSILSCYMLFRLGKLFFSEWAGLLAALILALYPASIHFSVQKVEYGPLLTLLGLLLIHETAGLSKHPSVARSLALGTLAGVAMLVNPVILAFYPFGLLWFVWSQKEWRGSLKHAVIIVGCCAVVIAPWLLRNYLVFDRFVFIRPNFSRELVLSNFTREERALGSLRPESAREGDGQMSAFFSQRALSLILQKPAAFLQRIAIRVPRYWTSLGVTKGRMRLIAGTAYYPILCLGLAGVWAARRREVGLLIVYLLTMPLPFYLTWTVMGRFRFPIEPIMILFASYAVTSLLSHMPLWRRG